MCKISIIIPVYNGEKYIKKTVNTILNTRENKEVILIDDGSTDKSWEICKELERKHEIIKIIHKENGGIAEARNTGLKIATGEYICFCDQDDYVEENIYSIMKQDMLENDVDLVISNPGSIINGRKINNNSIFESKIEKNVIKLIKEVIAGGTFVDKDENGIIWTSIWNCMFRKEIIDKRNISFNKFIDYEDDTLFLIDYLSCCKTVYMEAKNIYYWREHAKSESHKRKYICNYNEKSQKKREYIVKLIKKKVSIEDVGDLKNYLLFEDFIGAFLNECYRKNILLALINNYQNRKKIKKDGQDIIIQQMLIEYKNENEKTKIFYGIIDNPFWATIKYRFWILKDIIMMKI